MYWKISKEDQEHISIDIQDHVPSHFWAQYQHQETQGQIQFNPKLNCFFLKDANGVERKISYRNLKIERYPDEGLTKIILETSGKKPSSIERYELDIEAHIPGLNRSQASSTGGEKFVRSPMVGKVIKVLAKEGESVEKGQELLVIEAMKMENKIISPVNGIIGSVKVQEGAQTSVGEKLLSITSS